MSPHTRTAITKATERSQQGHGGVGAPCPAGGEAGRPLWGPSAGPSQGKRSHRLTQQLHGWEPRGTESPAQTEAPPALHTAAGRAVARGWTRAQCPQTGDGHLPQRGRAWGTPCSVTPARHRRTRPSCPHTWRGGKGVCNGDRGRSVWDDENVLEADGCTTRERASGH